MARPEADVVAGVVSVSLGDGTRRIPVLKIAHSGSWKDLYWKRLHELISAWGANWRPADGASPLAGVAQLGADAILELLSAYDATESLGRHEACPAWHRHGPARERPKERIDEVLDDAQAYAVLKMILDAAFPTFEDGLQGMMRGLRILANHGASSVPANLPNSPSPSGDFPPPPSSLS